MHVSSGRWLYGFVLAMITTVLWAVLPIMLKEVLKGMDPYTVTWFRLFSAGVVLFIWLAVKRRLPSIRALSNNNRWLLVVAIVGLACNYVFYLMGLSRLTPGTMQLMIQTAPIMLMFGSMLVFRERFGLGQVLGVLVLLPGFVLFFNQRLVELFTQMTSYTLGILITLAAALTWALYGLAQKQLLTIWSSITVMMVIYLACSLLLLPLTNPLSVLDLTGLQFWLLVACCLNTLIAYGAFAEALVHWEASRVSATIATTPLFTFSMVALGSMLWPSVVQPELLNSLAYLGALMVVVGSALVALAPSLIQNLKNRRLRRLAVTPPPAGS